MAHSFPLSSNCARRDPSGTVVTKMYKIKGQIRTGGNDTGGLARYYLSCSKEF